MMNRKCICLRQAYSLVVCQMDLKFAYYIICLRENRKLINASSSSDGKNLLYAQIVLGLCFWLNVTYIVGISIFLVSVRIFEYKKLLTSSRNISKRRLIRDSKTTYKQFANDGLFNRFISRVSTKLLILSSIYRLCCISINVYYVQVFFKAFVFRQKYHAA